MPMKNKLEFLRDVVANAMQFGQNSVECPNVVEAADQTRRLVGFDTAAAGDISIYILTYLAAAEVAWHQQQK